MCSGVLPVNACMRTQCMLVLVLVLRLAACVVLLSARCKATWRHHWHVSAGMLLLGSDLLVVDCGWRAFAIECLSSSRVRAGCMDGMAHVP
jgi:hypothetical protein